MRNIKIVFLLLMSFYFAFHFILPASFFYWFGYKQTYQLEVLDYSSMQIGFLLNLLSLTIAGILIIMTPVKFKIKSDYKGSNSHIFLVLSLFFSIGVFLTNNEYYESLKTVNTRHDLWVLGEMFFNLEFYILFGITYSFNYISETSLFYIFIKILGGARSSPLVLLHYGMCGIAGPMFKKYYKKYVIYLIIAFMFGIFGFNWATKLRNRTLVAENPNKDLSTRVKEAAVIHNSLIYQIIGRISFLENSMVPIYYKNTESKQQLDIFYNAYSPVHQTKILINNLVPGDIFPFDVYPNQYYRAAFMGVSLETVRELYTSMNITLPVYVYMYSNFLAACVITGSLIWTFFIISSYLFSLHPLFGVASISIIYPGLLTFFDFVTVGKTFVLALMSAGLFLLFGNIDLKKILKRASSK